MGIRLTVRTTQARGQFNGGEIQENKPIGFPREGGSLKPYSNLFYWSHAWSEDGSTIGLHPHQGFEILSFVFEGEIEHFDTSDEVWKPIEKGGAQIIRSGNGISHSERLNAGAHMFQIWFDPNLAKTFEKPATYNDYKDKDFPVKEEGELKIKTYKGEGAPMEMDSPGVEIHEISMPAGNHQLPCGQDKIYSYYLIEGQLKTSEGEIEAHDFMTVEDQDQLEVEAQSDCKLFLVVNPKELDYLSYYETALKNA